jgi:thioredoxin-like negative regulator of GroEL
MAGRLAEGCAAFVAGRLVEAEAVFRDVLAGAPGDAEAWSNLAAVLNATQRHPQAETACRAAIAVQPRFWAAWGNLGTALHHQQRYQEAVHAYAESLRRNPANADAWSNLGVALADQGRMQASLQAHERAIALAPDNAEMRVNRAMALLAAGDLARGFTENVWRWKAPGMKPHGLGGPCWEGEDPAGRTILVHDEGGFGDTLQFVRYAPLLAKRGARVVLLVQPPLVRLLGRMPGLAGVVARGALLPPYDLHCPMLSLPHGFGTTLQTVPARVPYLQADVSKAACWRARLAEAGAGFRVGLVWSGAARPNMPPAHAMDRRRSLPPACLAPLAGVPGVRFVSLQAGPVAARPPPGLDLLDPMAECADFDDTAAVVAGLDLVISVDTAVAHLAGALGRPVWLLSRYDACWRWLRDRRDSPWYPTLNLYQQAVPGAWAPVIEAVAAELRRLAGSSAPTA